MAKIQKKSKQRFHLIPFFYFPPKDCPSEGQLSPLGFAACQSKNCTNRANVHQHYNSPTDCTEPTLAGGEYPPTDCTDMHRLGGYGIPAIPTQPQNYLPTECTEFTETTGGEYSPTDCTDFHRCSLRGCSSLCCTNKAIGHQHYNSPTDCKKLIVQDILPQIAQICTD